MVFKMRAPTVLMSYTDNFCLSSSQAFPPSSSLVSVSNGTQIASARRRETILSMVRWSISKRKFLTDLLETACSTPGLCCYCAELEKFLSHIPVTNTSFQLTAIRWSRMVFFTCCGNTVFIPSLAVEVPRQQLMLMVLSQANHSYISGPKSIQKTECDLPKVSQRGCQECYQDCWHQVSHGTTSLAHSQLPFFSSLGLFVDTVGCYL